MCSGKKNFIKWKYLIKLQTQACLEGIRKLHEPEIPAQGRHRLPGQLASHSYGSGRHCQGTWRWKLTEVKVAPLSLCFLCHLIYGSSSSQTGGWISSFHQVILDLSFNNTSVTLCSCSSFLLFPPTIFWCDSQSIDWLLSSSITCAINALY